MNYCKFIRSVLVALLLVSNAVKMPLAETASFAPESPPFSIYLPETWGEVSQFYSPNESDIQDQKPDFVLIKNVHCNRSVQLAISHILKCLKTQNLLPAHIAIEGAVGAVDIDALQNNPNRELRRQIVDPLVEQGEMPGVMGFVISEGEGHLYGVETQELYRSSIDMFRHSYPARLKLSQELDQLTAALAPLKEEPALSDRVSILAQDIGALRRLVGLQLSPQEIHRSVYQAIFALDHLQEVLTTEQDKGLWKAVSAAVDFYALTLLRDEALFQRSVHLRKLDQQATTVLIVGGFHAPGLTNRLREAGYSYAVITPKVQGQNEIDERLYVERLLGHPINADHFGEKETPPASSTDTPAEAALTGVLEAPYKALKFYGGQDMDAVLDPQASVSDAAFQAVLLRDKLLTCRFLFPPIQDIFTAMDQPWIDPEIKQDMIKERAWILGFGNIDF